MQPIGAVYSNMRRKSNTDPAQLINSAYQYNHTHHQHVMEAMKARSDENRTRSLSVSSSKSSNLGGETPTKAKTNITPNPLLTTDESRNSPSDGSKRSSLSPNPSLKSSKSSNMDEESPTRAHNRETNITDPNPLLTTDEARKACSDASNPDEKTPITDNKVTIPQTVCEGKADWIRKNLCCCFCRSEEQSQV